MPHYLIMRPAEISGRLLIVSHSNPILENVLQKTTRAPTRWYFSLPCNPAHGGNASMRDSADPIFESYTVSQSKPNERPHRQGWATET